MPLSRYNYLIYISICVILTLLVLNLLFSNNYVAFKCNYKAALFGSDRQTYEILKEFGGDPCMKKGPNRFKIYYSKSFKDEKACNNYINYAPQSELRADSNIFILGCEKK